MNFELPVNAFASGQIESKVWLCKYIERALQIHKRENDDGFIVWIYGGWVGLLAFLLWTRGKTPVKRIVNFDIDSEALHVSEVVNNTWYWRGAYRAIEQDLNDLEFQKLTRKHDEPEPHLIVNTAIEHMEDSRWFESIPKGKLLALQATNMEHGEHIVEYNSSADLISAFPISSVIYKGHLDFDYKNGEKFSRFMTIGFK